MADQRTDIRRKRTFRKDIWAEEGFMEEIPAVAVITFAVTAFMISAVSATGLYLNDQARAEALDRAKDITSAVSSYGLILVNNRAGHLSSNALTRVVSGDIKFALKNSGDMRVTISEKRPSDGTEGNGTAPTFWTFGTTNRSDAPDATITRSVLVGHPSLDVPGIMVYYIAILEVRTW